MSVVFYKNVFGRDVFFQKKCYKILKQYFEMSAIAVDYLNGCGKCRKNTF